MLRVRATAQRLTTIVNSTRHSSFNFDSIQQKSGEAKKTSLAFRLARLKQRTNEEPDNVDLADPMNSVSDHSIKDARMDTARNEARYTMISEIEIKKRREKDIVRQNFAGKNDILEKPFEELTEEEKVERIKLDQFRKDLQRDIENENRMLTGNQRSEFGKIAFSRDSHKVHGPGGVTYEVRKEFFDKLFYYQKDGVNWYKFLKHFSDPTDKKKLKSDLEGCQKIIDFRNLFSLAVQCLSFFSVKRWYPSRRNGSRKNRSSMRFHRHSKEI